MGRGLSELQQTILLLGLQGREGRAQAVEGQPAADVLYDTILAEHWLWEPKRPPARARRVGKGRRFSQDAIGYDRYNHVHVVLSRAAARLVDRRLVTRVPRAGSNGVGVALTDAGVAAAHGLLERLARTRPGPAGDEDRPVDQPGPAQGSAIGGVEREDHLTEGWRQFGEMLRRRHEKIRRDEEDLRQFHERVHKVMEERRRGHERQQEEARQAQERLRQQQEDQWRDIREEFRGMREDFRSLREEAERLLGDSHQPRTPVLPPEATEALDRLGVSFPCSAAELKAAFRRKAHEAHSDHGGTDRAFMALQDAYATALKYAS